MTVIQHKRMLLLFVPLLPALLLPNVTAERLVAAGTLTECKARGDTRVCDGAVTKELKSTVPSVQVMNVHFPLHR